MVFRGSEPRTEQMVLSRMVFTGRKAAWVPVRQQLWPLPDPPARSFLAVRSINLALLRKGLNKKSKRKVRTLLRENLEKKASSRLWFLPAALGVTFRLTPFPA